MTLIAVATGGTGTRSAAARGAGLIVGGVVSLQLGAALAATVFPLVGPVGMVALRCVVAAAALALLARRQRRAWSGAGVAVPVTLGVVLAVMNCAVYAAIARVPLGVVITLEFLGPLGVAVARGRRGARIWPVLAAAGVLLLTEPWHGTADPVGVAYALGAGV